MEDHDWDVNNWKWDNNLFIAKPLNIDKSSISKGTHLFSNGPQPTHGIYNAIYSENGDAYNNGFHGYNTNDVSEKRRKVSDVEEEEMAEEEEEATTCLTLMLGGSDYPVAEIDVDPMNGGR